MTIDHWELIAKKLSGELSSEDESQLEQWLKSDPANEITLQEAEKIWMVSGSVKPEYATDVEKGWQSVKARIGGEGKIRTLQPKRDWMRIAAAVLALFVLGFVAKTLFFKDETKTEMLSAVTIEVVTTDSAKVFFLPDSSRIWLNANSRFTYPEQFIDTIRNVTLTGEAFFEVRADASRPFIVQAGKTETRVLGTSFNIKAYLQDENVELTVETGKVQFAVKDTIAQQSVVLGPQEQVTYNKTDASVKKQKGKKKSKWWEKLDVDVEKDVNKLFNKARKELKKVK
jgi:transmembrane sensor